MTPGPLLQVENLSLAHGDMFRLSVDHLELMPGRIYGLVGPNGSGKSTLLHALSLLTWPAQGEIFFRGRKLATGESFLDVRRHMTLVMENPIMFRGSVRRNLATGLRFHGVPKNEWDARIAEALSWVGLPDFGSKSAYHLSRGETQRIAIARALILEPDILFLDEPFAHVDSASVRALEQIVQQVNQAREMTVVFTTHDIWQAYRIADEVLSLVEGRLVEGSLENLFVGDVKTSGSGTWVYLSGSQRISVTTNLRGRVHVAIAPQDILLSSVPLDSSARNSFAGTIQQIYLHQGIVRVRVLIDDSFALVATITPTSLEELRLSVGHEVYATFKNTAAKVF